MILRYLIIAIIYLFISVGAAIPLVQGQEWVDVIVKVDTPKAGATVMIGTYRPINPYPLLVDKLKTVYLCRVPVEHVTGYVLRDGTIITGKLTAYFTSAKNGDSMYSGLDAWNKFQAAEQALAEKVLTYDRTDLELVDGKPTMVTKPVTLESARVSVIDLDIKKVKVPVKFSGTVPAIDTSKLKATAFSVIEDVEEIIK